MWIVIDVYTHGRYEDMTQPCFMLLAILIGVLALFYSCEVHPPANQCEIVEAQKIKVISVEGAILAEDGTIYKEVSRWEYTNETEPYVISYKYNFQDFWHLPWFSDWREMVLYVPIEKNTESLAV